MLSSLLSHLTMSMILSSQKLQLVCGSVVIKLKLLDCSPSNSI